MPTLIMMNGHVACLKTTIARSLAKELGIELVETHTFGDIMGKNGLSTIYKRNARYAKLQEEAEKRLKQGKSVILDGTFCRKAWRKKAYALCRKHGIKDVVIIRCIATDTGIIKLRLSKRRTDKTLPEHQFFRFKNYLHDLRLDEPPYGDKLRGKAKPAIITFDSTKRKILKTNYAPETRQALLETQKALLKAINRITPDKKYFASASPNKH